MKDEGYVLTGGRIVTPRKIVADGEILVEGQKITGILEHRSAMPATDRVVIDCAGRIVLPGFIDVHTHGGVGFDFTDDLPEAFSKLSEYYYSQGVTTLLATLSPLSLSLLIPAVNRLANYCFENGANSNICGIHLEGPYINKAMAGGNREEYIEPPDFARWREVFEAGKGFIRLMTVAPELPGIMRIIEDAVKSKIVISVGHTSADGEITTHAIEKGATQVTHLFNSMPALHHREIGVLAEALSSDKVDAQIIADGVHVHPKILRLAVKLKGAEHILLITDSIRATKVGDGEYVSAGKKVKVKNGTVYLQDGTLAGSTLVIGKALQLMTEVVGVDLRTASFMTSLNAARSLGIDKETGSLEPGKRADIVVLGDDFGVKMTMRAGVIKYQA